MVTTNEIMLNIMPLVKTLLMLIVGLGTVIGLGYYLFVVKRRRVWHVNVWEKKADGRLHLIDKDRILEKKINKGELVRRVL